MHNSNLTGKQKDDSSTTLEGSPGKNAPTLNMQHEILKIGVFCKLILLIGTFLTIYLVLPLVAPSRQLTRAKTGHLRLLLFPGADLIVESITLDPIDPEVGEQFDIHVTVRNKGEASVSSNFRVYLYVDPPDQPPTETTPDTSWTSMFGLNAGASFLWSRTDEVFTSEGAHHICAWVDRDDAIVEDDEDNNLTCIEIAIGEAAIGSGKLETSPAYALGDGMIWLVASIRDGQGHLLPSQTGITGTIGSTAVTFTDDGTKGDFESQDGLYNAWVEVPAAGTIPVTLYARGDALDNTSLTVIDNPSLLVVTDFEALYAEFRDTGTTLSEDWDTDGTIDYLELVSRTYEYAATHNGIVVDLPHGIQVAHGYSGDYGTLTYEAPLSTTNRFRMAQLLDEMIYRVNVGTGNALENIAIIGDDQVVPFFRVKDPQDLYRQFRPNGSRERQYPGDLGGDLDNPALIDSGAGYILSDVPYSTRNNIDPSQVPRPYPQMGVGRIFGSHPYQLLNAFDAYEQPAVVAPAASTSSLFYSKQDGMDFPLLLEREGGMLQRMRNWYGSALAVYSGAAGLWTVTDFVARLSQDDLASVWSHSTHLGIQVDTAGYSGTIQAIDLQRQDTTGPSVMLGFGCHLGYTVGHFPDKTAVSYYDNALVLPLLERGITVFAPGSVAYAQPGTSDNPMPLNLNELLIVGLADGLRDSTLPTVGESWQKAFEPYHATDPYWTNNNGETQDFNRSVHTAVAYGNVVYGLPTQPVGRTGGTGVQSVEKQLMSARRNSPRAFHASSKRLEVLIKIPEFRRGSAGQGRILYSIPQGGTHVIPPNGPPLPLVVRSYLLPADTVVVTVTQLSTSTFTAEYPVTLMNSELWTTNGQRITGTYEIPSPYPSSMYWWNVTDDKDGVLVTLSVVPLQYNPASQTVKLYHELAFEIEHSPPAFGDEPTIDGVSFNGGQPVLINSGDLPLALDIGSSGPRQLALFWTIRDNAGFLVASEQVSTSVQTGTTRVTLPVSSAGWSAGPMDLIVGISEGEELKDSENKAFLAHGVRIIERGSPSHDYPPEATQAIWELEVRDENGVLVTDLISGFDVHLDGRSIAAQVQEPETGTYEIQAPLNSVPCGTYIARIGVTDSRGIRTWRDWIMSRSCLSIYLPMILRGV